jgi:DNA repair exonuclease SbcCD nuclease subunit
MNVVKLKCDITEFVGVMHLADIHIRLTKRHEEYIQVFNKLNKDISLLPKNSCVVVAGDLFHSKSDLSPECVSIASNVLKGLADERPTVLIAGNHDATLSNKNRLDSLSPIVNALNHNNLFYLKDTGLYILGDILFNHMSVFDDAENYIKAEDIPQKYRRETNHFIALFHGPVDKSMSDVGYMVSNRAMTTKIFDGHDIVLLGDIHKHQSLFPDTMIVREDELNEFLSSGDYELVGSAENLLKDIT